MKKAERLYDSAKNNAATETEVMLEDVWFRYERNGNDIVRGISLEVKKGEFLCMVGGNGVGKSTALKLISGIQKPYRGKVLVRGKEIQKAQSDVTIGVLPQNPQSVFTEITAEEELFEALYYDKRTYEEKVSAVFHIIGVKRNKNFAIAIAKIDNELIG